MADTCGRHDTLGGACACESNTVRYALEKRFMHSCRDNFLRAIAHDGRTCRGTAQARHHQQHQLLHERAGDARRRPHASRTASPAPGKYVELRAEMDVMALVSNCPQLNNPCNGYNPTPVRMLVWDAPA